MQAYPPQQQPPYQSIDAQPQQNTGLNEFMMRYKKTFEKQKMPTINMTGALTLMFITPLVFVIFTNSPAAGLLGGSIFLIHVIFSLFGMHGCDKKERWSLLAYQYSCPVFSITYILLGVEAFVEIGKDNFPGTPNVFLGFAGVIYLFISVWMVYSFFIIRLYTADVEWMQQRNDQERLSQIQNLNPPTNQTK